jgi:hypothetical protein
MRSSLLLPVRIVKPENRLQKIFVFSGCITHQTASAFVERAAVWSILLNRKAHEHYNKSCLAFLLQPVEKAPGIVKILNP